MKQKNWMTYLRILELLQNERHWKHFNTIWILHWALTVTWIVQSLLFVCFLDINTSYLYLHEAKVCKRNSTHQQRLVLRWSEDSKWLLGTISCFYKLRFECSHFKRTNIFTQHLHVSAKLRINPVFKKHRFRANRRVKGVIMEIPLEFVSHSDENFLC